ncbi:MAG: nucleoside hydrolase [Dehalococcoidia bacterium]
MTHNVHLDTDLGGDTDDLCALALLLARPDVQLTGITTCIDEAGRRAGYVSYALQLAGRAAIPVAAGAQGGLLGLRVQPDYPDDRLMWPEPVAPRPGDPGEALDLLDASIDRGATIIAIGPYTNLALFEAMRPGKLARTKVVLMGGWFGLPRPGLPQWGANMDWNVHEDEAASRRLLECCRPILVPFPLGLETYLRAADLPRLERAGPLAAVIARQGRAHGETYSMNALGRAHALLPDDLLNFHFDPLACAVALGWDGVRTEDARIMLELDDGWPFERLDPSGHPASVVTEVDGARFNRLWLDTVAPEPVP